LQRQGGKNRSTRGRLGHKNSLEYAGFSDMTHPKMED